MANAQERMTGHVDVREREETSYEHPVVKLLNKELLFSNYPTIESVY